jgi:hypothetical protein
MAEPSQRWADMTALVDAMERGRGGTAVVSAPLPRASRQIEWAITFAEDGLLASAAHRWRDAKAELSGRHAQLGEGGLALGATLLDVAAEAKGSARRRGLACGLEVLEDAARYLEAAGDLDMIRHAYSLAATACEQLKELFPIDSLEHVELERRAAELRARCEEDYP